MIILQIGHFWFASDSFQKIGLKQRGFIRHSEISRHKMFQTILSNLCKNIWVVVFEVLGEVKIGLLSFIVQNHTRQKLKLSTEAFLSKSNIENLMIYLNNRNSNYINDYSAKLLEMRFQGK